jgi:glycerol-3-phosphate dehydrogenase
VEYDLVVIGGGINGAALARLAAFQGLRVGLFEAGDFGQGASTNTSKLIHGGLRYLETFDFGLVRDAVHERSHLLKLAPHLVEQRRFLFPRTRLGRHWRPAIKAGMALYDFLAGGMRLDPHRWVPPSELRKREPHFLPQEENVGAYEYSDCSMDDARMVMENLVDARALGADIRNYHRFTGVDEDGRGNLEVTILDRLTGRENVVACRKLALCLGPWADQVAKSAFPGSAPQVRLSQGIHLVAEGFDSESCFILPVPGSKRYFFVFPWKGRHLIGTTETEVGEYPPDPVAPLEKEAEELKALCRVYFPDQKPEFICAFAGLRPLARARGSTITASREHEFHKLGENVSSAVGGKYTTHRTFAREFLRFVLGKEKTLKDIGDRLLPGAWESEGEKAKLRAALRAYSFVDEAMADVWLSRYGKRALELAGYVAADPARLQRLPGPYSLLSGELDFAIEKEWVKTAVDFLRRRTDIYFSRGGGVECLPQVTQALTARFPDAAKMLGRDADYKEFLGRNHHRAA